MVILKVADRTVGSKMFVCVSLKASGVDVVVEGGAGDPTYRVIKEKLIPALMIKGLSDYEATNLVNRGLSARGMGIIHLNRGRPVAGIY